MQNEPIIDRIVYHKDEPILGWNNKPIAYAADDIWLSDDVHIAQFKNWQVPKPATKQLLLSMIAVKNVYRN